MFESIESRRWIGRTAWWMAWFGLVAGQFHAMARHQTADGKGDLKEWTVRVWSDPARKAFKPLLDWASPDVVYVTWGKIWLPVFVALLLCALVVHRRRQPEGFERWAWRIALTGYGLACVAAFGEYWTSWTTDHQSIVDGFFPVAIVSMLVTVIGSTMLGISLLREGFRPRISAWLLALTIPGMLVVMNLTDIGSTVLPIAFAFGILGRRMARESAYAPAVAAPASV